jgi:hypothetical protein
MEIASPTLGDRKARLEDKDPVLALLSEISASLKDLNLTLKDHAERLAQLEKQKPGDESSPRDEAMSEQREGDDGPIQARSAHENPEEAGTSKSMRPELITQEPQIPQGTVDDFIEVKYGTFPPVEAYGYDREDMPQLWGNKDYLSWLKEKRLIFPDDGRYSFPFDIVALAESSDLSEAHQKIDQMKKFCRDLRKSGGLFFFRESYMQGGNKIWNGSDIFTLPDKGPLPFPREGQTEDEMLEWFGLMEIRRGPSPERLFSEPSTFYKATYPQLLLKAPFRRLW